MSVFFLQRKSLRVRFVGLFLTVTAAALLLSGIVADRLVERSVTVTTQAELERQVEDFVANFFPAFRELRRSITHNVRGNSDQETERNVFRFLLIPFLRAVVRTDQALAFALTPEGSFEELGVRSSARERSGRPSREPLRESVSFDTGLLDQTRLIAGDTVSGVLTAPDGTATAFAARALELALPERSFSRPVSMSVSSSLQARAAQVLENATQQSSDVRMRHQREEVAVAQVVLVLLSPVDGHIASPRSALFSAGLIGLAGALFASVWFANRLTRPLLSVAAAAARLAAGDHTARVVLPGHSVEEAGAGAEKEAAPETVHHKEDELIGLARSFNTMADELAAVRAAERSFLLSISHDLRTPLTSVKGYAEAVADGTVTGEAAVRAAQVIGGEAARLERLVNDLLDLARLETRSFWLHKEQVDLSVELSDLGDAFRSRMSEAGLDFMTEGGPLPGLVDPDRVGQMMGNLLENALRYVPSGRAVGLTWRAISPAGRTGRWAEISVSDTGDGIAPDDLDHVFDRLYVAGKYRTRRSVGTGLGLSIVRDLCAAMGGDVRVESRENRPENRAEEVNATPENAPGTHFIVRIPVGPETGSSEGGV